MRVPSESRLAWQVHGLRAPQAGGKKKERKKSIELRNKKKVTVKSVKKG